MRVRFLQHVPFEGPAALEPALRAAGHEIAITRLFAGEPLPAPTEFDWLIALGGPMSVHDEAEHGWLAGEKRLLRRSIEAGRRVLGVCLGAQAIAAALGAHVGRSREREIGWLEVERVAGAERSALGRALPPRFTAFHWHGETFALPAGAVALARSAACEQQAFALGERVLALQFHVETTRAAALALVHHCAGEMTPGPFVQDAGAILAPGAPFEAAQGVMHALLAALAAAPGAGPVQAGGPRFEIGTERMRLRPCAEGDVDALHALWTDPDVRRWLWDDVVIERATAAERVAASAASFARAGYGLWVAELRGSGTLVGCVGLVEIEPAVGPEILYAFHPRHWGRGLATEAARAVLERGFRAHGLARIPGRTDSPNRGSARVLERLGMRFEAETLVHGRPTLCYAITREAFAGAPRAGA